VTILDSLLKPIVIHRVVGALVQGDGTICYTTKGDNNALDDPSVVMADHVLGTPLFVIPKVGLLLLFMISPQGLVATIGTITLLYLGNYEWKLNEEREGGLPRRPCATGVGWRALGGGIQEVRACGEVHER
jgi:hypothetical protein